MSPSFHNILPGGRYSSLFANMGDKVPLISPHPPFKQ